MVWVAQALAAAARRVRPPADAHLDPEVLKTGLDLLYEEISNGYYELVGDVVAGEFVGHEEIAHEQRYGYSVVAVEPCRYFVLKRDTVLALERTHPSVAMELQLALGRAVHTVSRVTAHTRAKIGHWVFLKEIKAKFRRVHAAKKVRCAFGLPI